MKRPRTSEEIREALEAWRATTLPAIHPSLTLGHVLDAWTADLEAAAEIECELEAFMLLARSASQPQQH